MVNIRFGFYILVGLQICVAAQLCRFPDGRRAYSNSPCDAQAEHSMCCERSIGTVCLSNKLCQLLDGKLVRSSCSGEAWDTTECGSHCLHSGTIEDELVSCVNVTNRGNSFCCEDTRNCCYSSAERFEALPLNPLSWATYDPRLDRFRLTNSGDTSDSGTATSPANPSPSDNTSDSGASALLIPEKIGIGIGSAVGGILVALFAFLVWRMYQKNKKNQQVEESAPDDPEACKKDHIPSEVDNGKPAQPGPQELDPGEIQPVELPAQA